MMGSWRTTEFEGFSTTSDSHSLVSESDTKEEPKREESEETDRDGAMAFGSESTAGRIST